MDWVALLADAKAASLTVRVDGDLLVIRGPRSAGTTARMLLANKPEVIAALSVRQFIDQAAKLSAGGTLRQRPRPALSPVPLTALHPVKPGDEWLADQWYALRNKPEGVITNDNDKSDES